MKKINCLIFLFSLVFFGCKKDIPEPDSNSVNPPPVFTELLCSGNYDFPEIEGWKLNSKALSGAFYSNGSEAYFVNEKLGFIFYSVNSILFKTEDGGDSWKEIAGEWDYFRLRGFSFIDENIGFIYGWQNSTELGNVQKIYKTKNGGDTWDEIEFSLEKTFSNLNMINEMKGYVSSSYIIESQNRVVYQLFRTRNGGVDWTMVKDSLNSRIFFFGENYIRASGSEGKVFISNDGGDTWDSRVDEFFVTNKLDFIDENIGFASFFDIELKVTNTGGKEWRTLIKPEGSIRDFQFWSEMEGFVILRKKQSFVIDENNDCFSILYTSDGGNTWTESHQVINLRLEDIHVFNNGKTAMTLYKPDNIYLPTKMIKLEKE